MGSFDHLLADTPSSPPAASGGSFDHILSAPTEAPAEGPVSREQEIRREALKKLMVKEPDILDRGVDAYTFGMTRPLAGLKSVVEGKAHEYFGDGKPATAGEYWRGGVKAQGDYFDKAVENTQGPAGTAADIVGSVGSGLGGSGGKLLGRGAQAAIAGIQGAIGGASRNAEDVSSAAKGAAVGGTIDAATSWTLAGLLDRFTKGARKDIGVASRGGNSQTLEHEGSALFTKLDNAGIHFGESETPKLANGLQSALANSAYSRNVPEAVNGIMREVQERVSAGAMTYGDVRKIQTQISNLKANPDASVRSLAGDLGDAVDGFMHTAKPTIPASSVGTVSPNDLTQAKDLWSRASKATQVEHLAEKGTATASNVDSKVAKNFEKVVDKARSGKGYSPYANNAEQMRLMDEIVKSGPTSVHAEALNKFGNRGLVVGGLGAAGMAAAPALGLDSGTTGSHLGWTGTGLGLAAALASKGRASQLASRASRQGTEGVNDLLRHIATGSVDKTGAYMPRNALAKLIAMQDLARGGGNYAASYTDTE
jgi:hypothetical protein